MTMTVCPFDADRVAARKRLFEEQLENEPWTVFHGTSCCNAQQIEAVGFRPQAALAKQDIQSLVSVFEKMRWSGLGRGGYDVLKPFSLSYDSRRLTTFFAESSLRASLYASRDWAGGEKLRGVRKAFCDLDAYLHEPAIREQHLAELARTFERLSRLNAHSDHLEKTRPVAVALDWLESAVAALSPLRKKADDALSRHEHGVVYAVMMRDGDLAGLSWNSAMGLESAVTVSPSRIVARVDVPAHFESGARLSCVEKLQVGLIAALKAG